MLLLEDGNDGAKALQEVVVVVVPVSLLPRRMLARIVSASFIRMQQEES
jgi:hypothetical protein